LTRTTPADQGLVGLPALTPHLEFHDVGEAQTLLVSESFNTLLHGELYRTLLPLLDGRRSCDAIVAAVEGTHPAVEVLAAVASLSARGYVVSADHGMDRRRAAYWSSLGASPRWVETRLLESRVTVDGDDGRFTRRLEESGAAVGPGDPDLTVVVCDDYLESRLGEVNRRQLEAGAPWTLIAAEVVKWVVLGDAAPIHDQAIAINVGTLESSRHPVGRRPQCRACGEAALVRPDRPPVPLRLEPSPKAHRNSGGARSVAPEFTLDKYRHLVSPISGVVTWLTRTTDASDSWLHVYWAGSNPAMRSRSLSSLRRSLRSKSAGKGSTAEQSKVSALCEAIERHSGARSGDEIRTRRRFSQFIGEDEAIHPNDVQLFSENQLDNAGALNAEGHPYNVVPARLDPETEIDWTPVWSLTRQRHRYLPTSMLYSMPAEARGPQDLIADSNGCAAGNTLEEAILQGFYELAERDAFAIWWYNRLRVPAVDLSSFDDDYLASAPDYYSRRDRDLWVLDVTSDVGIPTFVALSRRPSGPTEEIIYGAGAHDDPRIAALRAICELNQCLTWLPDPAKPAGRPTIDDPLALRWWKTARLADCPWLAPDPGQPPAKASRYPVTESTDTREDVESCRSLVEARGMEFLVLDQTRPDIGMPVVRVIVPGMRHFWARFAPGRLYDVPVSMGRRERPLAETDLNPAPVIA